MRKLSLFTVGMVLLLFKGWAQSSDSYKNQKLKVDDVNIVSGYYTQTGNHSAVTGGIGTQKLSDISNSIDLRLVKSGEFNRKYHLDIGVGIDHHSAASSANVSKTGASRTGGTRLYPSVNWQVDNEDRHTSFGVGASYSHEYTYQSFGLNAMFSKKSTNENTEFTAKANLFIDQVRMVEPSELRPAETVVTSASGTARGNSIPTSPRNSFDLSLSLSQVVNKRMQVAFLTDAVAQQGYLGLPYYRVYFNDGTVHIENLPGSRLKLPLGVRMNYFLGDRFIVKAYYRYFMDNWGVKSHTISLETPVKITPFVSVSPFYRFYIQTAANFFAPYGQHTASERYYSSDYDYSAFSSNYEGVNLRLGPTNGLLGMKGFSAVEFRFGHYLQTTGLVANSLSMNLTFK
ncbi:MAG TPA: DUF3570 domain-containing protein [Chitinophagaceae bacterium]